MTPISHCMPSSSPVPSLALQACKGLQGEEDWRDWQPAWMVQVRSEMLAWQKSPAMHHLEDRLLVSKAPDQVLLRSHQLEWPVQHHDPIFTTQLKFQALEGLKKVLLIGKHQQRNSSKPSGRYGLPGWWPAGQCFEAGKVAKLR